MTEDEFVRIVAAAQPSREKLLAAGLDDEGVADIQATYRCQPVAGAAPFDAQSDRLRALITRYDCSTLEVSYIRFAPKPAPHPAGTLVGWWEADPLVVLESGEVVTFDHAVPSEIFVRCAASSAQFLDAIAFVVQVIADRARWKGKSSQVAKICVERAGGATYQRFYDAFTAFLGDDGPEAAGTAG